MYDQRDKNFNKKRVSLDQFNDFYDDYATYRRKDDQCFYKDVDEGCFNCALKY